MQNAQGSEKKPIKIYLAPMEGVVDPQIRQILTGFGGIDICTTEFVRVTQRLNSEAVFYKFAPELKTQSRTQSGTPVFIQLLGSDLNCMGENAALACELGAYGIDINFGCPAKTVNRHDGGSVILKNPERVFAITQAVRKVVPAHIPVTTKVRLGFEHKDFHKEIAQAAEAAGSASLVVHARTKVEAYKPPAHWEYIANIKNAVQIPIVANGDIWNVDDYFRCRQITGCDDVMLGRGLMAQPLLALQIRKRLEEGFNNNDPSLKDLPLDEAPENFTQAFKASRLEQFYMQEFVLKYQELSTTCPESILIGRIKQLVKLLSRHSLYFQTTFENIKRLRTWAEIQEVLKPSSLN